MYILLRIANTKYIILDLDSNFLNETLYKLDFYLILF